MNIRQNKGITLIALIITVIVMLILAGVSIGSINSGLFDKTKQAVGMYNNSVDAEGDAINQSTDILESFMNGGSGTAQNGAEQNEEFDISNGVNKPELTAGMIPIYYDGTNWKIADETNKNNQWYDYSTTAKQYANICTVSDAVNNDPTKAYRTAAAGTVIPVTDMTTMFVWIPRYAYSINAGGYRTYNSDSELQTNTNPDKKINITFLVGTTDTDKDGITYPTDYDADSIAVGQATPMIVHPGFTFGTEELAGIWIGKFEVSGTDPSGQYYVGNSNGVTDEPQYTPDTSTYVQVLPNAIDWKYATAGEYEYQAMKMGTNSQYYGWNNVNTHLIKNSEWGVAAYLCYSQYGQVPEVNSAGKRSGSGINYDQWTGAGPQAPENYTTYATTPNADQQYNGKYGVLASTTGNVYGIYDMSGGENEIVAGYLDNKNSGLSKYGNSTSDPSVVYFENNELKPEYAAYWDKYTVSPEEKDGATSASINTTSDGPKTQAQLDPWPATAAAYAWNDVRKKLADEGFDEMKANKGIGTYETTDDTNINFYGIGKCSDNSYKYWWYLTLDAASKDIEGDSNNWNGDGVQWGGLQFSFMARGRGLLWLGMVWNS
ncbi:MAG: hypothetical protein FWF46_06155 [Oscillospiraceae bacterium]|nr:hypothetical protein [Oscillospiraceae bacterium]